MVATAAAPVSGITGYQIAIFRLLIATRSESFGIKYNQILKNGLRLQHATPGCNKKTKHGDLIPSNS